MVSNKYSDFGQGFLSKLWTNLILLSEESAHDWYGLYVVDVGTGLAIFIKRPDFTIVHDMGSNNELAGNRFLDFSLSWNQT